jgi:chemotaxis receptor (MCP) glutamine deamidase CheD
MDIDKKRSSIDIPQSHQVVHEKEWKALHGGILITEGVQSCTLVALYDRSSKIGYLGHFTTALYKEDEGFVDMVERARTRHPGTKLEAWAGGAALIKTFGTGIGKKNRAIHNEMVKYNRDYVAIALDTINCDLTQDWLKDDSQILKLAFDTNTGTITYSTSD